MKLLHATVIALALAGQSALAQVTLKFANFSPAGSKMNQQLVPPFIDSLLKDSGGELKIEFFPGGTLGRAPDAQLRLVKTGVADIAWIIPYYTPGQFPDNDVFEVPLLVRNPVEGSLAITRMLERGQLRGYEDLKVLALLVQPPNILHTNFPIKGPEDLKGRKIRSAGIIQQNILDAVGATPVGGLTGPQVAENISRGLVDGSFADWVATVSFRIHNTTNYHYNIPVGSTAGMIAMSKARYDALPPAVKAAIDKNSGEAAALYFSRGFQGFAQENQAMVAADSKQTVREIKTDEEGHWKAAFQPGVDIWLKGDPRRAKTLAEAEAALAEIRRNPPK
jgi:TRAP-type transport system periplasmic protein